jgi:perosamine synthetase
MIPVSRPLVTEQDVESVADVLRRGFVSGDAPVVAEFERAFADTVGRRHGIAVSNGSVALDLAMHSLDLQPGDEVIVPSFTIASCLFAILRTPAKPVFVDVDRDTWCLSAETLRPAITPRTKALLLVHIYGLPVEMGPVMDLCDQYGITIVEDAAEAHTVRCNDQICGSFGRLSTFSFYANKAITCGEGGMVVTDDDEVAARIRGLRNLAFLPAPGPRFVHEEIGWNARMSALQAALGKSQLTRMSEVTEEKRRIGLLYADHFLGHAAIQMQPSETPYSRNMYWVVGLVLANRDARRVAVALRDQGVDSRPFFFPLHRQPLLRSWGLDAQAPLPVTEMIAAHGLYLPSFPGITDDEIRQSAEALLRVLVTTE